MSRIPVSQSTAAFINKFDPDAEVDYAYLENPTYDPQASIKANLVQAKDTLKETVSPKRAFETWLDGKDEVEGAFRVLTSPIAVPILMVTAPLRAAKEAIVDTIFHKIMGRRAAQAGADAVE